MTTTFHRRYRFAWYPFALAILLAVPGCFSLGPQENQTRFYVLGGGWERGGAPAPGDAGVSVGMRDLRLADYLQTPLIVVRNGRHGVRFAEFHRWAEDLGRGINRTVAGYLETRGGIGRVELVPWRAGRQHDYVVQIRVLRFEGVVEDGAVPPEDASVAPAAGSAHLLATWEVVEPGSGRVLRRGTTDRVEEGWAAYDYAGLVSLLDDALEALADDLAAGLLAR